MLRPLSAIFSSKTLDTSVRQASEAAFDTDAHRKAIWNIRELTERSKTMEPFLRSGAFKVLIATLETSSLSDEKLWALQTLKKVAQDEMGASLIIQEPNAVEVLLTAVTRSVVGSEHARLSCQIFQAVAQHISTQILIARDDVVKTMLEALKAEPIEASIALDVLFLLSESLGTLPKYASSLRSEKIPSTLASVVGNEDFSLADREKAAKLCKQLLQANEKVEIKHEGDDDEEKED